MVTGWRNLSVLIAGCGSIGKRHARVLRELGVSDLRACDPLQSQRESIAAQSPGLILHETFEEGLRAKPDVLLIGTPPKMHIPMAIQAMRAGCHVLCEKPLADSTAGYEELAQAIAETQRKFMVALCFRYHEGHRRARAILDSGRLGRLVSIRALVGEHLPDVRPDYRDLFSAKDSGAFDLMHEVDLAIWYAGQPVREVACFSGTYSEIGIEAPDVVELLIDFADRRMASIHLDFFQQPRRRLTELMFTGGVVTVEFARWDRCTVSCYEAAKREWETDEFATDRDDMFRAEDRDFLQPVAANGTVTCDAAEALKSVDVVEKAIFASRRSMT
ncbi:MAG: Gfo/Idh/MocA family oxidoreductase [Bryobacteraceae bacterium]